MGSDLSRFGLLRTPPSDASFGRLLLDVVLQSRFDADVAELLCAMLGRTLFRVHQLDQWPVIPFLVGGDDPARALLLNVLQSMFTPDAVGELAGQRRLASLLHKELVLCRGRPSSALCPEILQSLADGRCGEIAPWTAPIVVVPPPAAADSLDHYRVGIRRVTFRFDRASEPLREGLREAIVHTELPAIVARCLRAYAALRDRVPSAGGFRQSVPPAVLAS